MLTPIMVERLAWKTYLIFMAMVRSSTNLPHKMDLLTASEYCLYAGGLFLFPRDYRVETRGD